MKKDIHPEYKDVEIKCANCGTTFTVGTTAAKAFSVSICSQCHPAFTGKTTIIDSANRVSRFMDRQKKTQSLQKKK